MGAGNVLVLDPDVGYMRMLFVAIHQAVPLDLHPFCVYYYNQKKVNNIER